jgi:hypothetical protein
LSISDIDRLSTARPAAGPAGHREELGVSHREYCVVRMGIVRAKWLSG